MKSTGSTLIAKAIHFEATMLCLNLPTLSKGETILGDRCNEYSPASLRKEVGLHVLVSLTKALQSKEVHLPSGMRGLIPQKRPYNIRLLQIEEKHFLQTGICRWNLFLSTRVRKDGYSYILVPSSRQELHSDLWKANTWEFLGTCESHLIRNDLYWTLLNFATNDVRGLWPHKNSVHLFILGMRSAVDYNFLYTIKTPDYKNRAPQGGRSVQKSSRGGKPKRSSRSSKKTNHPPPGYPLSDLSNIGENNCLALPTTK